LCLGAVLVPLFLSLDLLWSAPLAAPFISLLWSLLWSPSVISLLFPSSVSLFYLWVSLVCVSPFICCPSNRVFALREEDSMSQGFISLCCGFEQFGCLGILSRWVATLTSDVSCIWEVVV
jgi:hypothetical protein